MKGQEIFALLLMAVLVAGGYAETVGGQLTPTFYETTCPNVDVIVRNAVVAAMNQSQIVGPSVLRIFAHDCFVDGCDASIMLEDVPGLPAVERDAVDNNSLQSVAFDTINQIKEAVEAQCPGVVSCSDLLSLASENVVNLMGGPSWAVPLGRRDGVNSTASSVINHLPGSNMNLSRLSTIFQGLGLTVHDLVTLSGAHTVGFAHCGEFSDRLYDFNNVTGAVDPSLSATYATTLKGVCPNGNYSITTVQSLDVQTAAQFDNMYYQGLQKAEGLLFSDQELYVSNATAAQVNIYANNMTIFFNDFVSSMVAFSRVGVLTGTQGEIRTNCSIRNKKSVNSSSPVPSPSPVPVPNPVPVKPPPPPPPAAVITASPPPPPQHLIMPPPAPLVVTPPPAPLPPVVVLPSPPPPIVIFPSPPPIAILPSPPPPIVIFPSPPPPAVRPLPVSPPPPALVPPAGRG